LVGPFGLDPAQAPASDRLSPEAQLALLRQVLALSQEAVAVSAFNSPHFLDCTERAHQRLGFSREEYLSLGPTGIQADAIHDDVWVEAQLQRIAEQGTGSFASRHRCKDGRAIDVKVHFQVLDVMGQKLILTLHRDRSELIEAKSRLEQLNELLSEAEELTQAGSWELIHTTGELTWSQGVYRVFEKDPQTFKPSYEAFLSAIHPDDRERVHAAYQHSLQRHEPYHATHRICFSDGREKVIQERGNTSFNEAGDPVRSMGTVQDISQLAAYEEKLERVAYVDSLTQLPNRQACLRHLDDAIVSSTNDLGVFDLDVDQFQAYNDTFGTVEGDVLLQSVARNLREGLPEDTFIARLESDEFLVICPCSQSQLESKASEIQLLLQPTLRDAESRRGRITVSLGACHIPGHSQSSLGALQAANTALMEAKKRGKGMLCSYSSAISERIRHRIALESKLDQALRNQEFQLAYQPQVNRDGALDGAEVLLRWRDSNGSIVPPSVFIPLAEQSGQIHAISGWVVEEACRQLQSWQRQGLNPPRLAINISAVQLGQPHGALPSSLIETLKRFGVEPDRIEVEITETALIQDHEQSRTDTIALSEAGFQVAIDDFGTGYASLVTLHSLAVDKIKVDTTFVHQLTSNKTDRAIVKSTILMAHEMGLLALAEGVETEEQWRILQSLDCDLYQGYLFGRPMLADAFGELLKSTDGLALRPQTA
jgi:diguanylate cyclase (GGDEF)-like protein